MNQEPKPFSSPPQQSCPVSCGARLLWLVFVLLSVSGWTRMADTIVRWEWLEYAGVLPGALYMAVTGGLWGAAGLFAAYYSLRARPWGRLVSLAVILFYIITYWIDRLFFAQASGRSTNTVFALLMTAAALLVSILILRPGTDLRQFARRRAPVDPVER